MPPVYSEMKPSVGICDIQALQYDQGSIRMSGKRDKQPEENVKLHFTNTVRAHRKNKPYLLVFGKQRHNESIEILL